MKNLLDELHKLDNDSFNISPDFSKNVMKKIKKSNRIIKLGYVASFASVACIIGISVFFVNKNGLFDKVKESQMSASGILVNEETIDEFKEETQDKEEVVYKQDVSFNDSKDIETSQPQAVNDTANIESKNVREAAKSEATYSKQLSKEKYLNEIINKLKINSYDISETDDGIIVYSNEFNEVYELLEEYIDIELSLSGDRIIIQLTK